MRKHVWIVVPEDLEISSNFDEYKCDKCGSVVSIGNEVAGSFPDDDPFRDCDEMAVLKILSS